MCPRLLSRCLGGIKNQKLKPVSGAVFVYVWPFICPLDFKDSPPYRLFLCLKIPVTAICRPDTGALCLCIVLGL
jgi:hypothetical protein